MLNLRAIKIPLLAIATAALLHAASAAFPASVCAEILFSEGFDGKAGGEVHGGRFVPTYGPGNYGWQAEVDQSKSVLSNYVQYTVAEGTQYSSLQGTMEMWLKNDRPGGISAKKPDGQYNTLFHFVGDGFALTGYILMESDVDKGTSALNIVGSRYSVVPVPRLPRPFGFTNPLGMKVARGQWVHLALTWGPAPEDNNIYVNGRPLELDVPLEDRINFGQWLAGAHTLRVGADTYNPGSYPDGTDLLYNWVIDDLKIHDEVLTSFDLSRLNPAIQSVTHDAFAVAGYSGKLVTGDTITVTMKADPGGKASFDLVQPASTSGGVTTPEKIRAAGIPMAEDPGAPGTYVGKHTVRYGQDLDAGAVVGRYTNSLGYQARPSAAARPVSIDTKVYLAVKSSNDLIPADKSSRAGLTISATDANGRKIRDHLLSLTLSATDEYTGILGGSSFEDAVGGSLDVDWGGVTDSFGEVTAQLVSGFAAKTMVVSAKDMVSGDVGVGWVRSYIEGAVEIVVKPARTTALSLAGSMELTASRDWLTADGRSRSRITAVVKDASGIPLSGHTVSFSLVGSNGSIRVIQSRTDSRGRAYADYVAGTRMGQVTIEVRDTTGGLFGSISIELRPDAPAKIALTVDPAEVFIGGEGSTVTAQVLDINDNPNSDVDVIYNVAAGEGSLGAPSVATDRNGKASVAFTPGNTPGTVTVRGTVTSRAPTPEEISAAEGAVFLYGLSEDPGVLEVTGWLVEAGDEVAEGRELVTLTDRQGNAYTVKSPRDGKVSVFAAEEGDEVEYGDTLCYILEVAE